MTGFFYGLATAMITPFCNSGVNLTEFGKMLERQIKGGADAVVITGTTGEPATMSDKEKTVLLEYAVKSAAGRIKIIAGTGSNDTKKAVENSLRAQNSGADGILAVTPYYNKCTQEGILKYYEAICNAAEIPVIAYNVPSRTGVNILPETAERLAEIPNIAGIKDASGNMAQTCETMRRIRGKADLYSGEDILNLPMLAIGCAGLISVISNVVPEAVKKLYTLVNQNKLEEACAVQDLLLPLEGACFTEVNPIPVKAACNMLGYNAGIPRPPLTELSENNKKILRRAMAEAGLI